MRSLFIAAPLMIIAGSLWAATAGSDATSDQRVRYKAGKQLDFEQLVIEGQLKRPELAVVTGDSDENGNGLLRLRENFMDRLAEAAGQEAQ